MKIKATIDSGETYLLRDRADYDRLAESIAPREKFTQEPERFPCLLLTSGYAIPQSTQADLMVCFYLYDFEIEEGVEELANHWRLELDGYFPSTEDAA
jgi:hypothetical protein